MFGESTDDSDLQRKERLSYHEINGLLTCRRVDVGVPVRVNFFRGTPEPLKTTVNIFGRPRAGAWSWTAPIPFDAPVTTATFPFSFPFFILLL